MFAVNDVEEYSEILLYCLSSLSGPLFAIGVASIYCLILYHNILQEHCYWYEYQIAVMVAFIPLLVWIVHPMSTEYLANFKMIQSKFAYIFLCFIAYGVYMSVIGIYNYNWTNLSHPMPLNLHFGASAMLLSMILATFVV